MKTAFTSAALRRALLAATASVGAVATATPAFADTVSARAASFAPPTGSEESPGIVIRNDLDPNTPPPTGTLDSGINGVGQMSVRPNPATTGLSLCTGTLINPRTVIFAAHCVNTRPMEAYGADGVAFGPHSGGTPIAFGFNADNRPAVRQWLGLDGGTAGATNLAKALFAVEQVWYDTRSLTATGSNGFIIADVAIATLDTPAFGIPTWAMLFSPLDGPTHATITGYGNAGRENQGAAGTPGGIAIDFRRRSAENMISVLGSFNDRDQVLFGTTNVRQNNLYMNSFNDPNPSYNPSAGKYDFGIFGDTALPREGTTAGGDSGGPLIVDQKYDRPVVAAVLSGGSRFFNAQQFHNYGSHSFYQPLHLYWDQIVANNPYVYAGNKAGDGDWEDAGRWVQLMDPNYMVGVNGKLVNSLPDTPAQGTAGGGAKFGKVCFLQNCNDLSAVSNPPTGDGTPVFVQGGPGSTDFVPDNVRANPKAGVKARYFDVTLSASGTTRLGSTVTIDKMTLAGQTKLEVKSGGALNVLGEYNQLEGWTNVDGLVQSGRDMLFATGMLSGSGTVKAPFVTVGGAIVAPGGGDKIGTLTVQGNMIMSSGSALFVDARRGGADKLAVEGLLSLSSPNDRGASVVFNKVTDAPAPRHGETFTIVSATGGIQGTFGQVFSFQGVLRPELTYGANNVTAMLRAGSLVKILDGGTATEIAFAGALDALRATSYNSLYNLYGSIDLMDGRTLAHTLRGLAPTGITSEAISLQDKQSKVMLGAVTDRLSMLGTRGTSGTMTIVGSAQPLAALDDRGISGGFASSGASYGIMPSTRTATSLPKGMSGFVSSGATSTGSTFGDNRRELAGQHSRHFGMGLEVELGERATLGTAFGYASGFASPGGEQARADSKISQAAVYGAYQFGGGVYFGALAAAEQSSSGIERQANWGDGSFALTGATRSRRYTAAAEAGVNLDAGNGLTLTPRASLGYASYELSGFRENGGEAALQFDDIELQRLQAKLGFKFAGSAALGAGWNLVPQLQADWVQSVTGVNDGMQVRFAAAPDVAFALPLAGGDTGWAEVRGGVKLSNGHVELGTGVESSLGRSGLKDDRAMADFTLRF